MPKDLLNGELGIGARPEGRPLIRYIVVIQRDKKESDIVPTGLEAVATDRSKWGQAVKNCIHTSERRVDHLEEERVQKFK